MLARKAFQDSSRDLLADNHSSCVALQLSGENLQLWLWLFRMRSGRRVIRWTLSPWCLCTPNPRCFLRLSANRDEPVTINWSLIGKLTNHSIRSCHQEISLALMRKLA